MSIQFRYEARGPSGRIERGGLSALDRNDALKRLRLRNLTPLDLKAQNAQPGAIRLAQLSDKDARDIASFLYTLR